MNVFLVQVNVIGHGLIWVIPWTWSDYCILTAQRKSCIDIFEEHPQCVLGTSCMSRLFSRGFIPCLTILSPKRRLSYPIVGCIDKCWDASEGSHVLAFPAFENVLCILLCAYISTCTHRCLVAGMPYNYKKLSWHQKTHQCWVCNLTRGCHGDS